MFNKFITSADDLVTTNDQTRAGFLKIALEKNLVSDPYVKNASAFKAMVKDTSSPDELLTRNDIRPFMLTAAGLSDKSKNYLTEQEQTSAIAELIEKFLKPSGANFIDETVYRYLLIRGDAVGGTMRNRIGALGQEKLVRTVISCMNVQGINYKWLQNNTKTWIKQQSDDQGIEKTLKAISWVNHAGLSRTLAFNLDIPVVKTNVDICLFSCNEVEYALGKIVSDINSIIMLGELKGGFDPSGADEHWKTANTALERIKNSFNNAGKSVMTTFVGAAIKAKMAEEIYAQLKSGVLANAANLTNDEQLIEYSNWILSL